MSKDTTELRPIPIIHGLNCPACGHSSLMLGDGGYVTCAIEECPNPDYAEALEALISNREKLAYRSGYAAGNAKKNYRKKVDAEIVEQLKTEITADVLAMLRKAEL